MSVKSSLSRQFGTQFDTTFDVLKSNSLYDKAGAIPRLDFNFAKTKSLLDSRSTQNLITFTRASTATYVDSDRLIKTASTNVPRFDHNPSTGESLGLLVEEARTNFYGDSSSIVTEINAINTNLTPSSNTVIAPDGTQSADQLVETVATGPHRHLSGAPISVVAGQSWTISAFIKPIPGSASDRYPGLRISGGTSAFTSYWVTFDLSTKQTYTNSPAIWTASGIVDYPNGWKRIYAVGVVQSTTASATYPFVFYSNKTFNNVTSGDNYTGDGVSGFYIWGAQLETGSFPTSYIPTTSATVTRSADVARITGTNFSSWYRNSSSTFAIRGRTISSSSYNTWGILAVSIEGIEADNNYRMRVSGTQFTAKRFDNGVNYSFNLPGSVTAGSIYNYSVGYDDTGHAASSPSGFTSTTYPGLPFQNPTTLKFVPDLYGCSHVISRLTYWPQRLTNTQLQALTAS